MTVLRDFVVVCVVYLVAVYGVSIVLAIVAFFENRSRIHESGAESWETIGRSRFTIPVSVIAPMHNEEMLCVPVVERCSRSSIRVRGDHRHDGSTDSTLEQLREAFDLQPFERFERRVLPSREVYAVYRSRTNERLTVVDKEAGGNKADSLNSGINFAASATSAVSTATRSTNGMHSSRACVSSCATRARVG